MRIVINGIGIAGPTLAYWLLKTGHDVVLVEKAPSVRTGGYIIDFWGIGYDVAEKMGLIPTILEMGYQVKEVRFVNKKARKCGGFSADVFSRLTNGRFTSLRRSDLAIAIYRALEGNVKYIFGDSISRIEEKEGFLDVDFEHAPPLKADLVVGADGLHSRVRELMFGPDLHCEFSLKYSVAAFEVKGYHPRDDLVYVNYAVPGRQVSRFAMHDDMTLFLFVFHDRFLPSSYPIGDNEVRSSIARIFGDSGWECPRIIDAMRDVRNIYFDRVTQIRMNQWTSGRTALIGDAAACVSLMAGEGCGLAMAEAYVLAGELSRSNGDYATAFNRFESLMTPFLQRKHRSAARFASSFAPQTTFGLAFRNLITWTMGIRFISDLFMGRDVRDNIILPDYFDSAR